MVHLIEVFQIDNAVSTTQLAHLNEVQTADHSGRWWKTAMFVQFCIFRQFHCKFLLSLIDQTQVYTSTPNIRTND